MAISYGIYIILFASPAVGYDDTIYVGSKDNFLYSIPASVVNSKPGCRPGFRRADGDRQYRNCGESSTFVSGDCPAYGERCIVFSLGWRVSRVLFVLGTVIGVTVLLGVSLLDVQVGFVASVALPTIDVASDVLYASTGDFYSVQMFATCAMFCVGLPLLYVVWDFVDEFAPRDNVKASTSSALMSLWSAMTGFPARLFAALALLPSLRLRDGSVCWRKHEIFALSTRSAFIRVPAWLLICFLMIIERIMLVPIFVVWLFVALVLMQLKMINLPTVRRWLYGSSKAASHATSPQVDTALVHRLTLFTLYTESAPQIVIQTLNNVVIFVLDEQRYSGVAIASTVLSCGFVLVVSVYYGYYRLWLKREWEQIPVMTDVV